MNKGNTMTLCDKHVISKNVHSTLADKEKISKVGTEANELRCVRAYVCAHTHTHTKILRFTHSTMYSCGPPW